MEAALREIQSTRRAALERMTEQQLRAALERRSLDNCGNKVELIDHILALEFPVLSSRSIRRRTERARNALNLGCNILPQQLEFHVFGFLGCSDVHAFSRASADCRTFARELLSRTSTMTVDRGSSSRWVSLSIVVPCLRGCALLAQDLLFALDPSI